MFDNPCYNNAGEPQATHTQRTALESVTVFLGEEREASHVCQEWSQGRLLHGRRENTKQLLCTISKITGKQDPRSH